MFGFILADLRRHAAGVVFVVLLIALASALGVAVTLGERALRLGSARAASAFDLLVGAPGSETQLVLSAVFLQPAPLPLLPGRVLAALRADPRVAYAAPVGFGDFVGGVPVVGTTADIVEGLGGIAEGRVFQRLSDAVVGSAVDRALGDSLRPLHGRLAEGGHPHGELRYHVVGRMAPTGTPWDRAILVPIEAVWAVHGAEEHRPSPLLAARTGTAGHDHGTVDLDRPVDPTALTQSEAPGVPAIVVKPRSIADAYKLRQQYRGDDSLAVFPAEVLTRLYGTLGDARTLLSAVAIGAEALVAGAILLVVIVHVLQRRRQIGALRAFGAARGAIFAIVWAEVFAMIGIGILAGFAIGFAVAALVCRELARSSAIVLPVEFHAADAGSLAGLLAAAALVTLIPAALAYRQSPAEALRG